VKEWAELEQGYRQTAVASHWEPPLQAEDCKYIGLDWQMEMVLQVEDYK
jgi:hypothetical protein